MSHRHSDPTRAHPEAAAVADLLAELRPRVAGDLRADDYTRILYSTDASIYQVPPLAVLIPKTVDDVQAAIELAARHRVPVLPRGSGTSLAGQAVNAALVIDMSRHLDQVLDLDVEARRVRVQPGVVLDDLNRVLRRHGLHFGPDPASSDRATLGGIVANNATGSHSILYGMTADHLHAVDVILGDGSAARFGPLDAAALGERERRNGLEGAIYRSIAAIARDPAHQATVRAGTPRHWRRAGGYNLDRLLIGASASAAAGSGARNGGSVPTFHHPPDPRFNLARLVCGSEGTLAAMTAIDLDLVPAPGPTALAIVHFDDLQTALRAVPAILTTAPSAVELLDGVGMSLCRDIPFYARLMQTFVAGSPGAVLITEYRIDGDDARVPRDRADALLSARIADLGRTLDRGRAGATAVVPALSADVQANVWMVRKASLGLLMSAKGDAKPIPFIEDAAVPVECLAGYVAEIERFCRDLGTPLAAYAHASAGCLHLRPFIDARLASDVAKLPEIARFAMGLVRGHGGALSSEHGDGRSRSWLNPAFFGPDLYALYRDVKRIFDPAGLFNPGNIVDAPGITENLRYRVDDGSNDIGASAAADQTTSPDLPSPLPQSFWGRGIWGPRRADVWRGGVTRGWGPAAQAPLIPSTALDFTAEGGLRRAVDLCNGAGVCRKRGGGTMCPSFMVTRDEADSTRGRANALRAIVDGRLPAAEITGPRMHAIMDLCIGCKTCQTECPSGVDMAKLKFELLAGYHAAHGAPIRTRLFAAIPRLNRLGSGPLAPLANRALAHPLTRAALHRTLGIARERALPPLAREPFTTWFRRRRGAHVAAGARSGSGHRDSGREDCESREDSARPVVLFHDTFNTYNTPEVAIAAVEVLEAVGCRVELPGHHCCGRPLISAGLVDAARAAARDTVDRLAPFAESGTPIVGLEPSCVSALRDEYLYLLPGDPRARRVALAAFTFEEYIAGRADAGDLGITFDAAPRRLVLHGHCHQKALVGMGPARRVLGLSPGNVVEEVDAGCCGMAGAFGYEAEHYAVSMAMAERRLLPAVRAALPDTVIVAAGVSCRQQIAHGAGRRACHPAEVLRWGVAASPSPPNPLSH